MNWSEEWNSSIKQSSYLKILNEKGISNNDFWEQLSYYDEFMAYSRYPGKILERISFFLSSKDTILDIGAGTGAFTIPLSELSNKILALDPSPHQLKILKDKAKTAKRNNILYLEKEWKDASKEELSGIDYSIAAYSFFEDDICSFLEKAISVSSKGIFFVFRAGRGDPLREFVYDTKNSVDFLHLYNILYEMGYIFNVEIFTSEYILPLSFVYRSYPYTNKTEDEIFNYLKNNGRITNESNSYQVLCQRKDALLYLIK
ncbi:MAG: methyltransferase domain-containing protein [Candidatus Methanofastidiosum sp.]|nr:methyltransferase domain-containing protein [Methanofastidiosum sp.]NYT13338.1 class I SAM-dependent methyltransferase [Candidatus Methanofastidiosa archaeon]